MNQSLNDSLNVFQSAPRVLDHRLQLVDRVRPREGRIAERSRFVSTFGRFLHRKDNLLTAAFFKARKMPTLGKASALRLRPAFGITAFA